MPYHNNNINSSSTNTNTNTNDPPPYTHRRPVDPSVWAGKDSRHGEWPQWRGIAGGGGGRRRRGVGGGPWEERRRHDGTRPLQPNHHSVRPEDGYYRNYNYHGDNDDDRWSSGGGGDGDRTGDWDPEATTTASSFLVRTARQAVRDVARAAEQEQEQEQDDQEHHQHHHRGNNDDNELHHPRMSAQDVELAALTAGQIADLCIWQQRHSNRVGPSNIPPYTPLDPWDDDGKSQRQRPDHPPSPPIQLSRPEAEKCLQQLYRELEHL